MNRKALLLRMVIRVLPERRLSVVVNGDPFTKISDIDNVAIVFKGGIGYDSAKLIASVRGLVGLRETWN